LFCKLSTSLIVAVATNFTLLHLLMSKVLSAQMDQNKLQHSLVTYFIHNKLLKGSQVDFKV